MGACDSTEIQDDQQGVFLIGETLPNFRLNSTLGEMYLYQWFGKSWGILASHPAAFTPICTTELAELEQIAPEFERRDVKVASISCNSVKENRVWEKDILEFLSLMTKKPCAHELTYPIFCDVHNEVVQKLGMLSVVDAFLINDKQAVRKLFIVDPRKM